VSTRAEALVLDFGGVITRTLFETHDQTERSLGLPAGTLTWMGPFDPDTDPLWQRMLSDEISEREYWQARAGEVGRLVGEEWDSVDTLLRRVRAADPDEFVRPEAIAAIGEAKAAGKRVAVLSNDLDLFYGPEFRQQFSLMDEFDAVVDATYTKVLKPDPRAYRLLLDAIRLPAESCVFVDDQQRNIDGARAVGLKAVYFDVRDARASYNAALAVLGLPDAL
jgi:putative hydrolase of the HAD superfamily